MIHAVLFDLDGILVDFCDSHFEALNLALMEVCGRPILTEERSRFEGLSTRQKLAMMSDEGRIDAAQADDVYYLKQDHTRRLMSCRVRPNESKTTMCRELERSYRLACVSNCIRDSVELLLGKAGLRHFFSVTVSNEDVARPKPAPDCYLLACRRLGVGPGDSLAVEDNEKGMLSAEAAGCHCLQVGYPDVSLLQVKAAIDAVNE